MEGGWCSFFKSPPGCYTPFTSIWMNVSEKGGGGCNGKWSHQTNIIRRSFLETGIAYMDAMAWNFKYICQLITGSRNNTPNRAYRRGISYLCFFSSLRLMFIMFEYCQKHDGFGKFFIYAFFFFPSVMQLFKLIASFSIQSIVSYFCILQMMSRRLFFIFPFLLMHVSWKMEIIFPLIFFIYFFFYLFFLIVYGVFCNLLSVDFTLNAYSTPSNDH